MSKKKTRERQLASFAAKREAERRRKRRQRIVAGIVAIAVAGAALVLLAVVFLGGDEPDPSATPTTSPSTTVSPTPTVSPSPTPTPEPLPVACDAEAPPETDDTKRTFKAPDLTVDLDARYVATVVTSCGTMEIELFPREAPYTVNSFAFLAGKGYYDGIVFHRLANTIDVIQAGNPQCLTLPCDFTKPDGPGYTIPDELKAIGNDLTLAEGVIAMANGGPNTGGSQFFIITGELGEQLPPNYTVFGEIVGGLDVAQSIQELPVGEGEEGESPQERIYIESITVEVTPGD